MHNGISLVSNVKNDGKKRNTFEASRKSHHHQVICYAKHEYDDIRNHICRI